MPVKFFGQYLLEKGLILPRQLMQAVKYQAEKNLRFGQYAVAKGYLTEKDVEKIQNQQKSVDKRFGEIAQDLNILTRAQVEEILTMQKNDHKLLGRVLVKKELLTSEVVERELVLFKEDQSKYDLGDIVAPPGVRNPEIVREIVDLSHKMLQRMTNLNAKVKKGFISKDEPQRNFLLISIFLSGNLEYEYVLSMSNEISRLVTAAVLGSDTAGISRELISDGVKEFCNIVCGNIIARLSQKGRSVDISTPREIPFSDNGYNLVKGRNAIYYPIVSPKGDSALILIER
ncbi:MAG TPA: hypothetical protein ENG95_02930 [Nitrospirae bacterium]|nr:bacteriophage N4 adsorption protein B [bacterium BMS3Bbin08]HDO25585.1 hypothetical protein [Nitrospirota bacterium]HDZ84473.1 hypothetical protein [Nitrospirota bacterium]